MELELEVKELRGGWEGVAWGDVKVEEDVAEGGTSLSLWCRGGFSFVAFECECEDVLVSCG